jgi:hypothetical protein
VCVAFFHLSRHSFKRRWIGLRYIRRLCGGLALEPNLRVWNHFWQQPPVGSKQTSNFTNFIKLSINENRGIRLCVLSILGKGLVVESKWAALGVKS